MALNRGNLKRLADLRIAEAELLLANGMYPGDYYLAGYAVECALKACIAKQTRRYDFPDRRIVNDSYTHDLARLLQVSGLKPKLEERATEIQTFALNWSLVENWSEESRYKHGISRSAARDLVQAVDHATHGVLTWLKTCW